MKRTIYLVIAVLIVATVVAGCATSLEEAMTGLMIEKGKRDVPIATAIPDGRSEEEIRLDPLNMRKSDIFVTTENKLMEDSDLMFMQESATSGERSYFKPVEFYERDGAVIYSVKDGKVIKFQYVSDITSVDDLIDLKDRILEDFESVFGSDYLMATFPEGVSGEFQRGFTEEELRQTYEYGEKGTAYLWGWTLKDHPLLIYMKVEPSSLPIDNALSLEYANYDD